MNARATKHVTSERRRAAYAENKNGFRDKIAEQRKANAEQIKQQRLRYYLKKISTDDSHRLRCRMSVGIRKSLRTGKGGASWLTLVPYTLKQLKSHLMKTMPEGYTWDDFMTGELHIDHILPVSKFNITSASDIDFGRCWALKNLRLLPAAENISKHAKLAKPLQPSFAGI